MKNVKIVFTLLFAMFLFTACEKETTETQDLTMEDAADAEVLAEDYNDEVLARGSGPGGGSCPTISFAQAQGTFPNVMTIDFGTSCETPSGRVKKGKIVVTMSAPRTTQGATWVATTNNYYVDDAKVEGTITHTYYLSTTNGSSRVEHTSTMNITLPSGKTISWTSTRTRTQTAGAETPLNHSDDAYSITGSAQGVNREGQSYSVTITKPLIRKVGCPWITEGTVARTKDGKTWTLDFGAGTCDRKATVTNANGETKEITLRR